MTLYALKATSRSTQPYLGKLAMGGSRDLEWQLLAAASLDSQASPPVNPIPLGHFWGEGGHKLITEQGQIGACHCRMRLGSRGSMSVTEAQQTF